MKKLILASFIFLAGCASIINSERSAVIFKAPPETVAKVQTPDGVFEVHGTTSSLVSNSRRDIPIEVTCNGVTQKGLIPTTFSWGWGGVGNLLLGPVGVVLGMPIDGFGNRAYSADSKFDISALCSQTRTPAVSAQ
jgi:hypothetical protein